MTRLQFVEKYRNTLLKNYCTKQLSIGVDIAEMYREGRPHTCGELGFDDPITEAFYQGFIAASYMHNAGGDHKLKKNQLIDGNEYAVTFNNMQDTVNATYIEEYAIFSHFAGSISYDDAEKISECCK